MKIKVYSCPKCGLWSRLRYKLPSINSPMPLCVCGNPCVIAEKEIKEDVILFEQQEKNPFYNKYGLINLKYDYYWQTDHAKMWQPDGKGNYHRRKLICDDTAETNADIQA